MFIFISHVHPCNSRVHKTKGHARKIAWPSLAPFGGITRIRFKGSPVFGRTLSQAAPPHSLLSQNKTRTSEVNCSHDGHKGCEGARGPNDVVPF